MQFRLQRGPVRLDTCSSLGPLPPRPPPLRFAPTRLRPYIGHSRDGNPLAVLASLLLVLSCGGSSAASCNLGTDLAARAGSSATDCGHARLNAGTASVDDCVVRAFGNHAAFFAQYDRIGTDSKLVFGLVGDSSGRVTFLLWDGDPSGGSGAPPVITGDRCEGPSIDSAPGRDTNTTPPIVCASTVSLGRTCG